MKKQIIDIALTGPPCSGKSTAISSIIEFGSSLGIPTASVPEAATELKVNGILPDNYRNPDLFQGFLVEKLLYNESFFGRALRHSKDVGENGGIKICDRGLNDCIPYAPESSLRSILSRHQLNFDSEIMSRYAKVIFMELAPEEFYTTKNNKAREETYSKAQELRKKTLAAWIGHHDLSIVGNDYGSFEGKVNAVLQVIAQLIGVPKPLTIERKYLVSNVDFMLEDFLERVEAVPINIVQHYLDDGQGRVRAWTRNGITIYFHTKKSNKPSAERVKTERIISCDEYQELLKDADPGCAPIEKVRHCFIDNNQYFRLDTFSHESSWQLLEVQPTTLQEDITVSSFMHIAKEVTDDPQYYNYNIAIALAAQRNAVKTHNKKYGDEK